MELILGLGWMRQKSNPIRNDFEFYSVFFVFEFVRVFGMKGAFSMETLTKIPIRFSTLTPFVINNQLNNYTYVCVK